MKIIQFGILIILTLVFHVSCNEKPTLSQNVIEKVEEYPDLTKSAHFRTTKMKIDGMEYLVVSTGAGIAIIKHGYER